MRMIQVIIKVHSDFDQNYEIEQLNVMRDWIHYHWFSLLNIFTMVRSLYLIKYISHWLSFVFHKQEFKNCNIICALINSWIIVSRKKHTLFVQSKKKISTYIYVKKNSHSISQMVQKPLGWWLTHIKSIK